MVHVQIVVISVILQIIIYVLNAIRIVKHVINQAQIVRVVKLIIN